MRWLVPGLLLAAQLGAADFLAYRRAGNLLLIQTNEGTAEVEWVTSATFRYRRALAPLPGGRMGRDAVEVTVEDLDDRLAAKSKELRISIFKQGMRLEVEDNAGKQLALFADGALEREFDLRKYDFFPGASGYGVGTNRKGDCFFFAGSTPKEILEQRNGVIEPLRHFDFGDLKPLTPADLPRQATRLRSTAESLEGLVSDLLDASTAGVLAPALDVSRLKSKRALQLAAVFPLIYSQQPVEVDGLRAKLASYLVTYFWEARDRGFPLIRSLGMQYPKDPAAVAEKGVFMLGDELLIAPFERPFYLPQGIWTDLTTDERHKGRQKLEIKARESLPVFLRNGSILPVDGDPLILHYTPALAAEFFLYEPDLDDYSQFHAAPSLDWMRLEMESKKPRNIEWIVHNVDRPKEVERAGAWRYDEKARKLHVMVRAPAGADVIVNLR